MRTLPQNNKGFTLVELMMALLITMVGLIGLLKSVEMAMAYNLKNQLRNEAVLVGEKVMAYQKVRAFDTVSSGSTSTWASHPNSILTVPSRIRSGSINYTVRPASIAYADPTGAVTSKLLIVTVTWPYKGVTYLHEVRSIRSQ